MSIPNSLNIFRTETPLWWDERTYNVAEGNVFGVPGIIEWAEVKMEVFTGIMADDGVVTERMCSSMNSWSS